MIDDLVADFIDDPTADLALDCVEQQARIDFAISASGAELVFGTSCMLGSPSHASDVSAGGAPSPDLLEARRGVHARGRR